MTVYRICLLLVEGDRIETTDAGGALMMGVCRDEMRTIVGDVTDANDLPLHWKHGGRQRASEARAHRGDDSAVNFCAYWAHKEWGDDVELYLEVDAHRLWLNTERLDVAEWLLGTEASQ